MTERESELLRDYLTNHLKLSLEKSNNGHSTTITAKLTLEEKVISVDRVSILEGEP